MTPVMVQWLKVQTKEAMLDVAWGQDDCDSKASSATATKSNKTMFVALLPSTLKILKDKWRWSRWLGTKEELKSNFTQLQSEDL